jgi:hypothetical protein
MVATNAILAKAPWLILAHDKNKVTRPILPDENNRGSGGTMAEMMTSLHWHPMEEPDQSTKDRMVLLQEVPGMRIFDLDGQQVRQSLVDGHWAVYEEPEPDDF